MTVPEGKMVVTKVELALVTPQISGSEAFYEINALRYSNGGVQLHSCTGPMEDVGVRLNHLIRGGAKFYSFGTLKVYSDCADIQVSAAMYNAEKVFRTFPDFGLQNMPTLPLEGYCSGEFDEMLRLAYEGHEEKLISDMLYKLENY